MSKLDATILSGDDQPDHETLQQRVYQRLRLDIMTGQFRPGRSVTIRGLAQELGTSPMPVREALRRLVAERALHLLPNRRVSVPDMTPEKYKELVEDRVALETLAARRALPHIDEPLLDQLAAIDSEIDTAIENGIVDGYLRKNMEFHFTLYRAAPSTVTLPLIESLWLQMGPFLYLAMHRTGLGTVEDQHVAAMNAIRNKDEEALAKAIELDILDGANRLPQEEFARLQEQA